VDVSERLGPEVDSLDRFSLKKEVEYPYSIWLVPIPVTGSMYSVDVTIHWPHIGKQRRQEQSVISKDAALLTRFQMIRDLSMCPLRSFMLYYDYFKTTTDPAAIGHFNLTPLASSVAFPSSLLESKSSGFNRANAFPLPLIFDNFARDSIMYTPDEGGSFYRYQLTAPEGTKSPCGASDFQILGHAVLPCRILLSTTVRCLLQIITNWSV
jgi:hypothetical protein